MVPKKHKSKRIPASKRYKVEKKVREHHRKQRKLAKKRPEQWKTKKDPGIPNAFPFKEEMLHEIEQIKQRKEEERQRVKATLDKNRKLNVSSFEEMARMAQQRGMEYEDSSAPQDRMELESAVMGQKDNSKKAYYKEFKKVIDGADVILQVLDARDPLGTRAKDVEQMVIQAGPSKRLIFILNKIDLVPKEVVQQWLTYLRHEYPTLAFKASTQTQRSNLTQSSVDITNASSSMLKSSECLGAETLMQLLKNYARNAGIKTAITVGIIGFPNVGKSSLINSLKRSKVCQVGSTPGITKATQTVTLDKSIKLLDCPGIVFSKPKADGSDVAEVLLRNCVKVELVQDPIAPVDLIIQRCSPRQLEKQYSVLPFVDTRDFLLQLAKQRGRLKRGGIPDLEATARIVLQDWNSGKIPYYTLPPARDHEVESKIVSKWAKEFAMPEVVEVEKEMLDEVKQPSVKFVKVQGGKPVDVEMDAAAYEIESEEEMAVDSEEEFEEEGSDDMDEDEMSESSEEPVRQAPPPKKTQPKHVDELNLQHGKSQKQQLKKQKKQQRRLDAALDMDEDSDFDFDVLK